METLVELLSIETGRSSKDRLVSSLTDRAYRKFSCPIQDYEDEDGYEEYPDFDYSEDI